MRLGIDMDGVICNWVKGARVMLNERFPDLKLDIYKESETWDEIKNIIAPDQWKWLWHYGVSGWGLFAKLEIMSGALGSLDYLAKKHEVYLLTDRPKEARFDTYEWVVRNLPSVDFAGIVIGKDKWRVPCDIYLDDKPENVVAIASHRTEAIPVIRTKLYNKDFRWPFRVCGWAEFEQFVKERED